MYGLHTRRNERKRVTLLPVSYATLVFASLLRVSPCCCFVQLASENSLEYQKEKDKPEFKKDLVSWHKENPQGGKIAKNIERRGLVTDEDEKLDNKYKLLEEYCTKFQDLVRL
jgi:hypothetical protein